MRRGQVCPSIPRKRKARSVLGYGISLAKLFTRIKLDRLTLKMRYDLWSPFSVRKKKYRRLTIEPRTHRMALSQELTADSTTKIPLVARIGSGMIALEAFG